MLKMSNLLKNNEYEALFRFAYAPEMFIKIDYFDFDKFKSKNIASICKDVVADFKMGSQYLRFERQLHSLCMSVTCLNKMHVIDGKTKITWISSK